MDTITPRENFDKQLSQLQDQLLAMSSMVEQNTLDAVDSLKKSNREAARGAYAADKHINRRRFELEERCIELIATQQPMARDIRILASTLEISSELERMGDYAKGIARICLLLSSESLLKLVIDDLSHMAELTTNMLHRALGAFVSVDDETAAQIPAEDDQVDELYIKVTRTLTNSIIADPATVDQANYLSWAAHNLERMADRVTNICERTVYIATGEMQEFSTSDDELEKL